MSSINVKARRKRLMVLADFLEHDVSARIDGAKFDMAVVGETDNHDPAPPSVDETSECGFAGCAMGWAYYCPTLRKAGIRKVVVPDRCGLTVTGYNEVGDFFGITEEKVWTCFEPRRYSPDGRDTLYRLEGVAGIRTVAAKLREVAAKPVE